MSQYERGRRWEWRVRIRLENSGWLVCRCAGSKPFDLLAFHPGKLPLWVDCRFPRRPPPDETLMSRNLAKVNGARYIVPVKKTKQRKKEAKHE